MDFRGSEDSANARVHADRGDVENLAYGFSSVGPTRGGEPSVKTEMRANFVECTARYKCREIISFRRTHDGRHAAVRVRDNTILVQSRYVLD